MQQPKCGFQEQWAPLISQLPLVFTPGKWRDFVERQSILRDERVAGCSALYLAEFGRNVREFWGGKSTDASHCFTKKKKRHLWSLECSRQLQYPQCNSGQCAEFSVDIGSKLHSPSISSASTMTLISAQQLTRIDLVVGNGSL